MFVHARVEKAQSVTDMLAGLCTCSSTHVWHGGKENGEDISVFLLKLTVATRESLNREVREVAMATWAESGMDASLQYS